VNSTRTTEESLAGTLSTIERVPLGNIPMAQAARVTRRIVDKESLGPRIDVAAFNSAP
jgi:FXSXX-COOH protein